VKTTRAHVVGPVFFDFVFSGLPTAPRPGTEVQASYLGISPGGAANIAVALARLGVDVAMSAVFADDPFGHYLWAALADEGIDLTYSATVGGWSTPVTSSVAIAGERQMVTYAEAPPVSANDLFPMGRRADAVIVSLADVSSSWLSMVRRDTPLVFADVAWEDDPVAASRQLERLGLVDVFLPNAAEALASTRCATVAEAAVALSLRGPLVVVKNGASGALAVCPGSEAPVEVPAVPVDARDTTGAGDVFDAGFVYGSLSGWPIDRRLRFANLCAAESVKMVGGAFAAPCWLDLDAAHRAMRNQQLRRRYSFLDGAFAAARPRRPCRRSLPGMDPACASGAAGAKVAPS